MPKYLTPLVYISIIWGLFINLAVVLNLDFALPLAAGGQYSDFPVGIRVVYFVQAIWLSYQLRIFDRLVKGLAVHPRWIVNVFMTLAFIGFVLNIVSPSTTERWNAVALGLTFYGFYSYRKNT
jgi:hypothetical protein